MQNILDSTTDQDVCITDSSVIASPSQPPMSSMSQATPIPHTFPHPFVPDRHLNETALCIEKLTQAGMLEAVESLIRYKFHTPDLLWEAIHSQQGSTDSNRRLAILGDTVLSTCLAETWYKTGTSPGVPVPECSSTSILLIS